MLITGESGTGKEVVARAIHDTPTARDKPFVPFNCAAIPREMLESQLFGHRRGAFTGADRDNPGVIRAARGGTLFLDEIGELGLDLQPKLLRFLESGEISPLGETTPFTVNVRIVAATNANLERLVQDGRFREDLFYRLNVVRLPIPPLRERRDEIPALVHHFIARAAAEYGKGHDAHHRRNHGPPGAVLVAGQHPPAEQRDPPHGGARRTRLGADAERAVGRHRQREAGAAQPGRQPRSRRRSETSCGPRSTTSSAR